ncbi:MAG: DUF1015 domain-containing protein [Firmicutes bacterium]|nr:DUF1015 domain-containing protein [Bacillota bacterium]
MAVVKPFNAFVYDTEKIADLSAVVSPPYDVIPLSLQEELYQRHPWNFVRLILGKEYPSDSGSESRYTRACRDFSDWIDKGVFRRLQEKSFFICELEFLTPGGIKKIRTDILSLVKLEDYSKGVIIPHEKTLLCPKLDRLNLMKAVNAHLEPLFFLYEDGNSRIKAVLERHKSFKPLFEFANGEGIIHRLWQINDSGDIKKIESFFKSKKLFIADGHHRYETALNYCMEKNGTSLNITGRKPYHYCMAALTEMNDEGVVILPTHRLIKDIAPEVLKDFPGNLTSIFWVEKFEGMLDKLLNLMESEHEKKVFALIIAKKGLYFRSAEATASTGNPVEIYYLKLKEDTFSNGLHPGRMLDVSILHDFILDKFLGISARDIELHKFVHYIRSPEEAMEKVKRGEFQMAFLLNPTKIQEVKNIALAGGKMPQKSTYFHPKLTSGLVIYKF